MTGVILRSIIFHRVEVGYVETLRTTWKLQMGGPFAALAILETDTVDVDLASLKCILGTFYNLKALKKVM